MERNHSTATPCLSQEVVQPLNQKGPESLLRFSRERFEFQVLPDLHCHKYYRRRLEFHLENYPLLGNL